MQLFKLRSNSYSILFYKLILMFIDGFNILYIGYIGQYKIDLY